MGSTLTILVGLFRDNLPLNKCSDEGTRGASSVLIAAYLNAVWHQEVAAF